MKELVYADYTRILFGTTETLSCMDCDYLSDPGSVPEEVGIHLHDNPTHTIMFLAQKTTVGMFRTGTALADATAGTDGKEDTDLKPLMIADAGYKFLLWDMGGSGWYMNKEQRPGISPKDAKRFTMNDAIQEVLRCAARGGLRNAVAMVMAPEDASAFIVNGGFPGGE